MEDAVKEVLDGMALSTVTNKHSVSRNTLRDQVPNCGSKKRPGADPTFSSEDEEILTKWILCLAKAGFPLSKVTFLASVSWQLSWAKA